MWYINKRVEFCLYPVLFEANQFIFYNMSSIDKSYNHENFEKKIYSDWEKSGYFGPEKNMPKNPAYDRKTEGKPFVIPIPPPNITGKLHIGHSLFLTVEDIMIRYHRMKGAPTLWIPGMDHAGIATQAVVEKDLRKRGSSRRELGREKFIEEVLKWKEKFGGIILDQTKRMGASCDWTRSRFTLDDGMSKAVRKAFVELYNKGLIYRGEYIVNWCPKCYTAISDDEVEYEQQKAKLYYFRYDKNFPITIATTRPETKLGDSGVAVNPDDKRYAKYVGKEFDVEIDGVKRKIKVFADRSIDKEFGTGALGVTPAHSVVDWKMGEQNKLDIIKVIDESGKMTKETGKYAGLKAEEARKKLVEALKAQGLMEKEEDYDNNLSTCYRCHRAIEPLPSLQWFVKMKPLAEKAKKAVESGDVKILPVRFEKTYYQWMDNIRDWCISRQLWWGHRIPVWYKNDEIHVGEEAPSEEGWVQDEDVLDTWFSSALWPFSTLGWPEKTKDFNYFYPATVLETGYDILFFWVARMIMFGLEFTGKAPFETVYLHGLVRDEKNRKLSKSLGNALDPLDLIPKYGTDALRMSLVVGNGPGQDICLGENKVKGYRNFANKIWNASRFVLLRVTNGDLKSGEIGNEKIMNLDIDEELLTTEDKYILNKHENIKKEVTEKIEKMRFSLAGEAMYDYFWHDFCDKYIETSKSQLENEKIKENTKKILIKILKESMQMLHPFVPFVTEAVWQELRKIYELEEFVMIAKWPK